MTEKLKDRPFALVGVNNDGPREEVAPELAKNRITWRNVIDGNPGRLTADWNIHTYPTLYILDAKGVIRARGDIYDGDLDRIVQELLDEDAAQRVEGK